MNLILFFDKLNKISLYSLLFLIPVFFLPLTQNVLDFPKQILALFLVLLSLIGWLGKNLFEGKLVLRENKIFYLALVLVFFSLLLSSVFSLSPEISFFGSSFSITDSFLTFILFLVLAFVVVNSFKKENEFIFLLFFFLLSGAIAGILNLFQAYGIFIFPFDFAKNISFNTVGTVNSFAIFSAALLPLALILAFILKGFLKITLGIISFIFAANIILINFASAWIVLIIGILVLFVFGMARQKNKIKTSLAFLLMAGLIVSIFFYFFPMRLPGSPALPLEASLSFDSEAHILKGTFGEGIKNTAIGTGPGTFVFNYSKHRPVLLNQTLFWGTRFTEGSSAFWGWVITKGILGGAALLFLYFSIILLVFKKLGRLEEKSFYEIKLGLFAGALGLIFAGFLYTFNFVIYFTLWFLLAGLVLFFSQKLKEINLSSQLKMISANLIFVVIIVLSLSLFFLQGQRYFAEIKYLSGMKVLPTENIEIEDIDKAINYLQEAASLNPSADLYWRDLSQLYLSKANLILINQDSSLSLGEAIERGADAINRAKDVMPMNVANWNVRGFFYRNLIGIEGASIFALDSYEKASELDPFSPFIFGEKGRVYILMAQDAARKGQDDLSQESLSLAVDSLRIALELKPDYAPAQYLLAVAYDQKGEIDQAISRLEEMKTALPRDAGIAFQLGTLYWRGKKLEKAQYELERALSINSNYSNARYVLGLVYDQKGEKEKARQEFLLVAQANPNNREIDKILDNIEKGLPALENISLSDQPVQQTPPEISPY